MTEKNRPKMAMLYGARALKLDRLGYRHTLRICNTHYVSTATIITRTRLIVTLYVHCLIYGLLNLNLASRDAVPGVSWHWAALCISKRICCDDTFQCTVLYKLFICKTLGAFTAALLNIQVF